MGIIVTYDGKIFHNPSNKFCIVIVKTADTSVPKQARDKRRYEDHLIRFTAVGYEIPMTDAEELELDWEWVNGKYGMQLQVEQWREVVHWQRISIFGGSAGGYTALMLSALQMGNCATIATAPISNVYFNFYQYFPMAERDDAPFFLKLVTGMFLPIQENFPDKNDMSRWEALSAVGLADCFSNSLIVVHVTSDILVPIDQTTREFTYDHEGDTMPEGFSTRLPADNPGVLGHSLADELPSELTHIEHILITDPDADSTLYYDHEKPFKLNIFDDGPPQATGSHRATSGTGVIDDTPYLEEMFSRSLAQTELLMPRKLLLLLERYQGNSVQLPVHEGVDDTVYGSLAVYRQEVVEELGQWAENHSLFKLDTAMREAIANAEESGGYLAAWEEIKSVLE